MIHFVFISKNLRQTQKCIYNVLLNMLILGLFLIKLGKQRYFDNNEE